MNVETEAWRFCFENLSGPCIEKMAASCERITFIDSVELSHTARIKATPPAGVGLVKYWRRQMNRQQQTSLQRSAVPVPLVNRPQVSFPTAMGSLGSILNFFLLATSSCFHFRTCIAPRTWTGVALLSILRILFLLPHVNLFWRHKAFSADVSCH